MSAVVKMIRVGTKPPCQNGRCQKDSARMAVVKMIRGVWWTPCQNDKGGIEPPCQNGTAPERVETPRWRKRRSENENAGLLGQVFDISKYARLTDQAEPQVERVCG